MFIVFFWEALMKHFRMYFPGTNTGNSRAQPVGRFPQVDRVLAQVNQPSVLRGRPSERYVPNTRGFGKTESLEAGQCRLTCDAVKLAIAESDATQVHVAIFILSDRRVAGALHTARLIARNLEGLARDFEYRGCVVNHIIRIIDHECNACVSGLKITATLS